MNFGFSEEQQAFRRMLRDWVERECPKSVARDLEAAEGQYPYELWDSMTAAGFHAIGIDPAYGGQGGTAIDQALLCAELGRSLAGLTWIWGISSFAGAKSLSAFGSDEQKERFLPDLAEGKLRFAISVTEPGGGTDLLGALRTTAERCDGGWRINGRKIWCTAAAQSDYLLLLARSDPDPPRKSLGTTVFLVPQPSEGLELTSIPKLGMRSVPSYEVYLDGVFVPDELVLGEAGRGWHQLLASLNNERILVAALCCGVLEGVLEEAVAHLNEREAFGRRLGEFQALQHYVADIKMWQRQAELITYEAAWLQSIGEPCGTEATMAKVLASEYAVAAADLGIQMFGGMGYAMETHMQRYWRDTRIYRIAPINNEMARSLIAESCGLPRGM